MIEPRRLKIKVCGLKDPDNMASVASLEPDYTGFIFYERSPRYAGKLSTETLGQLSKNIKKTGVFVNETIDNVLSKIKSYNLDAVQLHGTEDHEYCTALKALKNIEIIKAFGVGNDFDFNRLKPYLNCVDYFLFDTLSADLGGSGKVFDWKMLTNYKDDKPYFLSGGINMEHIPVIKEIQDERLFAIDINSRFESSPGFKDIEKLKLFFEKIG